MESQAESIIGRLNTLFPPLPRWQVALLTGIVVLAVAHALLFVRAGAEWPRALAPLVPLYCLWRRGPSR